MVYFLSIITKRSEVMRSTLHCCLILIRQSLKILIMWGFENSTGSNKYMPGNG